MRVKLKPGEQRRFISEVLRITGWTCKELGERCGVGKTAIIYWRQERNLMPQSQLERMAALAHLPLPAIEALIDDNERRRKGGRISQQRRHDHPENYPQLAAYQKQIIKPEISPELAEFIGIMLGDGGIAAYQVTVTLNFYEEQEYAAFVTQLVTELFGLESTLQQRPDHGACVVVISSIELVRYLQELRLVQGNKVGQQCGVPDWIFADLELMRACLRGLMDTDGSVYEHTYTIKAKAYTYVKATFAVHSPPLMEGFRQLARAVGLTPGAGLRRIGLSTEREVRWYYEEGVGTHNSYHWRRYLAAVEATKQRSG